MSNRDVVKLTPEMQSAWVAYEAPFELTEGMRLPRVCSLIRHAFFAGMIAAKPEIIKAE